MLSNTDDPKKGGQETVSHDTERESMEITPEIVTFISQKIKSVGHLDAIMLFAEDPNWEWDAESISRELRSNTSYASVQIADLLYGGLVQKTPNGKYKCCGPENRDVQIVNKLKIIYKKRPSSIISLIYDKALHNISGFVEAFKIRKE